MIAQETRRLARLVENLLDQSRLEAGVAEPHRRWMSVEEVLAAALEELAARPGDFTLSVDRDLPFVRADSAQLERAFVNVLENARRHADGHAVSVRARAVRTHGARNDRVIVRVVDRGPGIPLPQLERVFEPFYRAGAGASGGHPGSGLGLAIARGFAQANGGKLYVESLPGQGATFVFELPLDPVPARLRRAPTPPLRPPRRRLRIWRRRRVQFDRSGCARRWRPAPRRPRRAWPMAADAPRVLVVDDELQIVRALRVVLRDAGFEVVPAQTAAEALDRAAVRPPQAAIVDLVLPDGDGIEVTRSLRQWSEMPILVLSAVGEEEQKVRALEAGADDYVTKPFGTRELVARLQAALRRAGARGRDEEPRVEVDGLAVDFAARTVSSDGQPVHLTPIEFDLCAC